MRRFLHTVLLGALMTVTSGPHAAMLGQYQMPQLAVGTELSQFVIRVEGKEITEHQVTDIKFTVLKYEGDAREMLVAENQSGRDHFQWNFGVALEITADGKTYPEGYGQCSTWDDDVSFCGVEDDGGHFLLRRELVDGHFNLTVVFRTFPEYFEDHKRTGITISYDDWTETLVNFDLSSGTQGSFTFVNPER